MPIFLFSDVTTLSSQPSTSDVPGVSTNVPQTLSTTPQRYKPGTRIVSREELKTAISAFMGVIVAVVILLIVITCLIVFLGLKKKEKVAPEDEEFYFDEDDPFFDVDFREALASGIYYTTARKPRIVQREPPSVEPSSDGPSSDLQYSSTPNNPGFYAYPGTSNEPMSRMSYSTMAPEDSYSNCGSEYSTYTGNHSIDRVPLTRNGSRPATTKGQLSKSNSFYQGNGNGGYSRHTEVPDGNQDEDTGSVATMSTVVDSRETPIQYRMGPNDYI